MFLERVVAALTSQQKAAALTTWLPAVHTTLLELYLTPPLPQLAQLQLGDPTAQPPTSTSQVRVFPYPALTLSCSASAWPSNNLCVQSIDLIVLAKGGLKLVTLEKQWTTTHVPISITKALKSIFESSQPSRGR